MAHAGVMTGATAYADTGLPPRESQESTTPAMHIVTLEALMSDIRRVLHRVQAGDHLTITQEGRPIVFITPAILNNPRAWKHRAAADGQCSWYGGPAWMPETVVPSYGVDIAALIREMRDGCL